MDHKLKLPEGFSRSAIKGRAAVIQQAVINLLGDVGHATSAQMAKAFGMSVIALRFHVNILHSAGEIRRGPPRPGNKASTWELAGSVVVEDDRSEFRRSYARAVQRGDVQRDVLVAALFGPAGTRGGCQDKV